jgi:DNA sulfur modification protein DndB
MTTRHAAKARRQGLRGFLYSFPAMRGVQAGREFYVLLCPLRLLPKLFLFDEEELPPKLRAQRTLNRARVPEIARYLTENPDSYVLSSLTASVDAKVVFEPVGEGDVSYQLGQLSVPMSARFVINDGQHRRAAVEEALKRRPGLGDETVSVVLFQDAGLRRSQQMFADLNKHAVRPSRSLGVLYDYRDPLARLAREIAETVPAFIGMVDVEKTSISNRSRKSFTLSAIYQATEALLGRDGPRRRGPVDEAARRLAVEFWTAVSAAIPDWLAAARNEVKTYELRREYVHAHAVALHALGIMGHSLLTTYPDDWTIRLRGLEDLDWSRANSRVWGGRALVGGRVSKAQQNVLLTSALLKTRLGLPLSADEARLEGRFVGAVEAR